METKKSLSLGKDLPAEMNRITGAVVDAAFAVHKNMGPGLLESIYESCLIRELKKRNLAFERQRPIQVIYDGEPLEEKLRVDLIVEGKVIIELKAVDALLPIHEAQLLTYLKLTGCEIGLLINFNVRLIKNGIQRVALSRG